MYIHAGARLRAPMLALAIVLTPILVTGCGYRTPASDLPGGARRVQVKAPDVSRTDEPLLSQWLAVELTRNLTRRGIRTTRSAAQATLHTRVLRLTAPRTALDSGGHALAARSLSIAAELRLSDGRDQTIWRSGLIELEQLWPLPPGDTISAEAARARVLQRLAARTAAEGVELLLSGL